MKIRIKEVMHSSMDGAMVAFESTKGSGMALWRNQSRIPHIGKEYDVEFDINIILEVGLNAFFMEKPSYEISSAEGTTCIKGLVEDIDDDGLTYFRVADNCLIMIEFELGAITKNDWLMLQLDPKDFEVIAFGE